MIKQLAFIFLAVMLMTVSAFARETITGTVSEQEGAVFRMAGSEDAEIISIIPFGESISFGASTLSNMSVNYKGSVGYANADGFSFDTKNMSHDTMTVTVIAAEGVNVKSSRFGEVIYVIPFGESITKSPLMRWHSAHYNGERGFVDIGDFTFETVAATPSITPRPTRPPTQPPQELSNSDSTKFWIWLGGIFAGIVLLCLLLNFLNVAKCPKCKARKPSECSRSVIRTEKITFTEKEQIKEYKNEKGRWGEVHPGPMLGQAHERIIIREYKVPGTRTFYDVKYKCQKCAEIYHRNEYVDTRD